MKENGQVAVAPRAKGPPKGLAASCPSTPLTNSVTGENKC